MYAPLFQRCQHVLTSLANTYVLIVQLCSMKLLLSTDLVSEAFPK